VQWGKEDEKVHSGMGESAGALFNRLQHLATSFAASGHKVVLVGHSLGAGVVALLAWLLRERCVLAALPG
jgi:pimeloyl-ACP methyl ester carboxylesterase